MSHNTVNYYLLKNLAIFNMHFLYNIQLKPLFTLQDSTKAALYRLLIGIDLPGQYLLFLLEFRNCLIIENIMKEIKYISFKSNMFVKKCSIKK